MLVTLGAIWPFGGRMLRTFADFGSALPGVTQFAIDARPGFSVVAIGLLFLAVTVARRRDAMVLLVGLGLLELVGAGFYVWALWLPLSGAFMGPIR